MHYLKTVTDVSFSSPNVNLLERYIRSSRLSSRAAIITPGCDYIIHILSALEKLRSTF